MNIAVVLVKMLHLLEGNIEMVELYLFPLRKYIGASVKIEDQIKGRRAIWLEEVKSYLRMKLELEQRAQSLVEERIVEILQNKIIIHKTYVPWWYSNLEAYRKHKDTLHSWKLRLIKKHKNIESCYI